jgi:hypothetical protein
VLIQEFPILEMRPPGFEADFVQRFLGRTTINESLTLSTGDRPMRWMIAGFDLSLTALLLLAMLCMLAQPAYAYVDPGSGLFAFQIISTTFAGMIFMLRGRLRSLVRSLTLRSVAKTEKVAKS